MALECDDDAWGDLIKECPECGDEVVCHFFDEDYDNIYLTRHCHGCQETFDDWDWEQMEEMKHGQVDPLRGAYI